MIIALTAAAYAAFGWLAAVVTPLVLALSLNRFFFPSKFELDDRGISARYLLRTQRLPWNELRRFVYDANGGFLSRRARRSRLDAYSGMHLLFGSDQEQQIIRRIRARMDDAFRIEAHEDSATTASSQTTAESLQRLPDALIDEESP